MPLFPWLTPYEEMRKQKHRTSRQKKNRAKAMRGRKTNVQRLIRERKR